MMCPNLYMSHVTDDEIVSYVHIYVAFQTGDNKLCIDLAEESDDTEEEEYRHHCSCGPRRLSVDPNYFDDVSNPVPGDLVIANLRDIKHPARKDPYFGSNFLILGAVVGFKPVDTDMIAAWKQGVSFDSYKKRNDFTSIGCQFNLGPLDTYKCHLNTKKGPTRYV